MDNPSADVLIAMIGVISMIVARLLDWYFPLGRGKSRRQISEDNKQKNGDNHDNLSKT